MNNTEGRHAPPTICSTFNIWV